MTNEERISKSNVVLSTLWEKEVTQKQAGSSYFKISQANLVVMTLLNIDQKFKMVFRLST